MKIAGFSSKSMAVISFVLLSVLTFNLDAKTLTINADEFREGRKVRPFQGKLQFDKLEQEIRKVLLESGINNGSGSDTDIDNLLWAKKGGRWVCSVGQVCCVAIGGFAWSTVIAPVFSGIGIVVLEAAKAPLCDTHLFMKFYDEDGAELLKIKVKDLSYDELFKLSGYLAGIEEARHEIEIDAPVSE